MTGASLRSEPPLLPPFQLRPHGPWPLTHHASAGAGERRRAKAGEPGFPGRAARHRHTPQWFLQHGSGPTPHGLAGHSVCFLKCVGVCACVCVCWGGGWWLPALMQMLAVLKNGSPSSPPLSFLVGKVYYGLLVLAVIFFLSRRTESQRNAPVIHFEIRHH